MKIDIKFNLLASYSTQILFYELEDYFIIQYMGN